MRTMQVAVLLLLIGLGVVCTLRSAEPHGQSHTAPQITEPFETGTVIVVAYSKKRIVIAADSRASFMKEGFQDEVCKIANPARNVLFAASGMVGARDWSATGIANAVARRQVGSNPYVSGGTLHSIAESWARGMAEQIRALPTQVVVKYLKESQTSAVFAALDRADDIQLVRVHLRPVAAAQGLDVRSNVTTMPVPEQGTRYLVLGRPQVAMEFLRRETPRAKAEVAKWPEYFRDAGDLDERAAIRLVELTGFFDPRKDLVGGSTSAFRLDGASGLRWLQRPPTCY